MNGSNVWGSLTSASLPFGDALSLFKCNIYKKKKPVRKNTESDREYRSGH